MSKLLQENREKNTKINLVWNKNSVFRNLAFLMVTLIFFVLIGYKGMIPLVEKLPQFAMILKISLLLVLTVMGFFMYRLYKSTISELEQFETETEKIVTINENALKMDRIYNIIIFIIFILVIVSHIFIYILN